ncbi:MAG: hypothetical protein KAT70_04660, partial [Thermoplasmata archaeon]|nr:hypothetical protein [Thermoplasmata archaeon]
PYITTSALTGDHVEEMFLDLGRRALEVKEKVKDDQFVRASAKEGMTLLQAADWLMGNFCDGFGGTGEGMPVVRKQFGRAGVGIKSPSKDELLLAIEYLAEVEAGFKTKKEVEINMKKRRKVVGKAKAP